MLKFRQIEHPNWPLCPCWRAKRENQKRQIFTASTEATTGGQML